MGADERAVGVLAAEVWHIKKPQKLPPVLSPEEVKRVLILATTQKARAMLSLLVRLRAGEVVTASGRHGQ